MGSGWDVAAGATEVVNACTKALHDNSMTECNVNAIVASGSYGAIAHSFEKEYNYRQVFDVV